MKVLAHLFHIILGTFVLAILARRQAAFAMCLVTPAWSGRVRPTERFREHREVIEKQVQLYLSFFDVSGLRLRGSMAR